MRKYLILFLLVSLSFDSSYTQVDYECGRIKIKKPNELIFNGTPSYAGQWPWLAALFRSSDNRYLCGSSIITRWHLLSAAHCVITIPEDFYALLGRFNLSNSNEINWQRRSMQNVYVHPDFTKNANIQMSNGDIAIFRVSEEIQFTDYVLPICLPDASADVVDVYGVVAGYGISMPIQDRNEDTPSHVMLKSIDKWTCLKKSAYLSVVSERSYCAGNPEAIPCKGDSGGGYYVYDRRTQQYTTYGIVSHSIGNCDPGEYVAFVDVPKFIPWIREKLEDVVINTLSIKMRNNECNEVYNYAKYHANDRRYQENLVQAAYGNNLNNVENILECISKMPDINDLCVTLTILYDEMKRNQHLDSSQLMQLAYRIKIVMEMEDYAKLSADCKNNIMAIKNNLPSAVKAIIWDGNSCQFWNYHYNEYMYAGTYFHLYNFNRRRVFTWIPGGAVEQGNWQLEAMDEGKSFLIKNTAYNEYLYAANDDQNFDSERRTVLTWMPGDYDAMCYWIIEPQNGATTFKVKNKLRDEYLYAAEHKYNSDRRSLFTWIDGSCDSDVCLWNITC